MKIILLASDEFYHLEFGGCHFIRKSLTLLLLADKIALIEPGVVQQRAGRSSLVWVFRESHLAEFFGFGADLTPNRLQKAY